MAWTAVGADGRVLEEVRDHGVPLEFGMVLERAKPGTLRVLHKLDPFETTRIEASELPDLVADVQLLVGLPSLAEYQGSLADLIQLAKRCQAGGIVLEYRGQ